MLNKIQQLYLKQEGSAIIITSLVMVALLSIGALAVDVGALFVTKAHLQKTANSTVLSGAQKLTKDHNAVLGVVDEILNAHEEASSLKDLSMVPDSKLRVLLKKNVPLTFSKLLGFSEIPVEAAAAAQILPMGKARGAAPLGIDDSIPLEFYKTYKLKVDQTEVEAGYFGVLALNGPGANTYEDNLKYGYSGEVKVGDIIDTQTGNIAGKTRSAIQERINACPYPSGDFDHDDCSRILLVPVYKPYNHNSNQLKQIEITGFAYFYIEEPMSPTDTSITGMFIKKVGTGYTDTGSSDKGAYVIKLIE